MPLQYKIDILEALKNAGYSTYRLRKEKILGERIIQQLRNKEIVSWATIDTLCTLLNCQPGDLVEHKKMRTGNNFPVLLLFYRMQFIIFRKVVNL